MSIQAIEKNHSLHVSIKDEMTIYTALEHKNQLIDFLNPDSSVQINLSGVSEIDSAGVQLLLYLKQEAKAKNVALSLTDHSQAVVEVLELLNLTAHFGDPIVISAKWKTS